MPEISPFNPLGEGALPPPPLPDEPTVDWLTGRGEAPEDWLKYSPQSKEAIDYYRNLIIPESWKAGIERGWTEAKRADIMRDWRDSGIESEAIRQARREQEATSKAYQDWWTNTASGRNREMLWRTGTDALNQIYRTKNNPLLSGIPDIKYSARGESPIGGVYEKPEDLRNALESMGYVILETESSPKLQTFTDRTTGREQEFEIPNIISLKVIGVDPKTGEWGNAYDIVLSPVWRTAVDSSGVRYTPAPAWGVQSVVDAIYKQEVLGLPISAGVGKGFKLGAGFDTLSGQPIGQSQYRKFVPAVLEEGFPIDTMLYSDLMGMSLEQLKALRAYVEKLGYLWTDFITLAKNREDEMKRTLPVAGIRPLKWSKR
jgi:hypothetical protein